VTRRIIEENGQVAGELGRLLLPHLPPARRPSAGAALETRLEEVCARARAAWPRVELDPAGFLRYLAERLPEDRAVLEALGEVQIEDLALAYACSRGDRLALNLFDRQLLPQVAVFLTQSGATAQLVEEVKQALRIRLFVDRDDGARSITRYAGRGPLAVWLRVVAIRILRDLLRSQKIAASVSQAEGKVGGSDPERIYVRRRRSRAFEQAFEKAMASVAPEERHILGLYFLEGLSTDAIGKLLRVDGSTVRRRIARIRESIFRATRRILAQELRLGASEVESILAVAPSQLDVSVCRFLRRSRQDQ
jgi:RNA polymerase sigma-70 factor